MKIHPRKVAVLIGVLFIYGIGTIVANLSDNLKVSRMELQRFYEAEMDSCTIQRIDTLNAENRGGYLVFYTNCSTDFYPIFLEDYDKRALIRINSIISKKANALDIYVRDEDNQYHLKIRHPETQDDRGFTTTVALVLMVMITVVILVLPNSMFERT